MKKFLPLLLILPILLVAYAVRVHQLGAQSFWYDEGVAFGHSQRTLWEMIPMLQRNVHVPLYFGTLAVWEDFVGKTEFALRYWSLLASVVSVAGAFALGKRLYGTVAGVASAGFVALNTFSVYYAQETRMYALLACIGVISFWVFVGFTQAYQRQKNIFAYAVALAVINGAGMYTHFSYALVMVAQGVLAVLWLLALLTGNMRLQNPPIRATTRLVREGMEPIYTVGTTLRAFLLYSIANLITVAFFYPWLDIALRQTSAQPNISDVLPLQEVMRVILGWFTFGNTFNDNMGGMSIAFAFLLLLGLVFVPTRSRGQWWRLLIPMVWVVVSVALYVYLELYARYLRFLIPTQIALAIWAGRGVWVLWHLRPRRQNRYSLAMVRFATLFAVGALWLTMAQGLPFLYDDPRYQRDDYRGLAQTIALQTSPQDAVILSAGGLQEIFGYYYGGSAPIYPLPTDTNPRDDVAFLVKNHPRLFVVFYGEREQDPDGIIESTLDREAFAIDSVWWDDMRFVRYASASAPMPPQAQNKLFGANITLLDSALSAESFKQGDTRPLLIALTWQTDAPLTTRYKVFVQVLDAGGQLVAQRDSEPVNGSAPTITWQANVAQSDHHALLLNALPSGQYTLIMGLYDVNTGERLLVENSDFVILAMLRVE
jgi:mannosyltransferase